MSLYDEQLENHPIWGSLSATREPLEQSRDKLADPEQVEIHARIEAILNLVDSRLLKLDAQLVHFPALDNINASLQAVAQSVRQFNDSPGNRGVLDQADNQAGGILAYLAQVPSPTADDVENLRQIGVRYRQSMSGHIGRITTEFNQLKAQVEHLAEQVTQQETQVSTEVSRLTEVATTAESDFTTAQDERREAFETKIGEFDARVNAALEEPVAAATGRGEAALADLKEKADAAWEEIAALRKRAEDASNYLGINALAGGYHQTAESEDKRAFWMRIGAIVSLVFAILVSGSAVVYHIAEPFSLEGVLTKALVAVPILVLAGYLARESSRHADRAHFNRQRQRQLESLPAYVDGIDDSTERSDLYSALAPGFFAPVGVTTHKGEPAETDAIAPLLALLLAELRKRADPGGG